MSNNKWGFAGQSHPVRIRFRALRWSLLSLILTLSITLAQAQWKDWDYDLDQEVKPWVELQEQLPAYPKEENLLEFSSGVNSPNRYFIDAPSVSVGDDGVVRYSLVIKTRGGAQNVSFEAIRCESREVKVYAFGHPNAIWSRARAIQWKFIEHQQLNNVQKALHSVYFCPSRKWTAPLPQILQALKNGRG
jgi:hypothetical protein